MKNSKVLLTIISVIKNDDQRFSRTLASLFEVHRSNMFEHIVIENIDNKAELDFQSKLKIILI